MGPPNEESDPAAFENPFTTEESAEERVYGTVLQTREPTSANAIADRADCDPKTARKYLEWFTKLGIVVRHSGDPITYERNDGYFEWREINDLAAEYTPDELKARVRQLTDRLQTYRNRYNATHPDDVDALSPPEEISVEAAFTDLTDWKTARDELKRYERARQLQANDTAVEV